jgi:hypothetical protein
LPTSFSESLYLSSSYRHFLLENLDRGVYTLCLYQKQGF